MNRAAFVLSLVLLGTTAARAEERPLPHRSPPFAKGYAEKIEPFPKRLTIRTRDGAQTFLWNDRTYFFHSKQKIVPEQINPGDLLAIRFTTTEDGTQLIQRLKIVPPGGAMKKVLVPLAPGFEEIEAITVIDILRRAGLEVTVAGTIAGPIVASRQTKHLPDCLLDKVRVEDFDLLVLPGGQPGTNNLRADPRIRHIIDTLRANNKPIAAICAAPTVLSAYGLLTGRTATSHPSVCAEITEAAARYSEEPVVVDGTVITSRAAGTAMEFAFQLVELLCGPAKVAEVNRGVLARLDS